MDKEAEKSRLKARLLRDVKYLCTRKDLLWSEPIMKTLRDFRESQTPAVFFGGTLRSLLVSRMQGGRRIGRPRDLDIVVAGTSVEALKHRFHDILARETRFGGLKLERMNKKNHTWHFDVWPLQRTWAFERNDNATPTFSDLPATTFFNLEAIAVDVWAPPGLSRAIYSGDDQFFEGILAKTVEINLEDNPFPSLCVVRALVLASSIDFAIGPKLARFLARVGSSISDKELEDVQRKHYGRICRESEIMRKWIHVVSNCVYQGVQDPIRLPRLVQGTLWPEEQEQENTSVHMRVMSADRVPLE